uniref:Uncharacterized protein n=1 Tax=Romanomermis culicivorax TaxID=13658 RepID=A0A915KIS9_ROMCU
MTLAGLANPQGSCRFHRWEKLQAVLLPNYQIKIFSKEWFKDLIFRDIYVSCNMLAAKKLKKKMYLKHMMMTKLSLVVD